MNKILAIGAHSDDIEFYAGATLAKHSCACEITAVIATDGRNGSKTPASSLQVIHARRKEQEEAGKALGIKKLIHLNFADGTLEHVIEKLKIKLHRIILSQKPDQIFTFDPERQFVVHDDFHPDHRALALAVIDVVLIDCTLAVKGGDPTFRPKLYLYNAHRPNIKVPIDPECRQKKLLALRSFFTQQHVIEKQYRHLRFERFRLY